MLVLLQVDIALYDGNAGGRGGGHGGGDDDDEDDDDDGSAFGNGRRGPYGSGGGAPFGGGPRFGGRPYGSYGGGPFYFGGGPFGGGYADDEFDFEAASCLRASLLGSHRARNAHANSRGAWPNCALPLRACVLCLWPVCL